MRPTARGERIIARELELSRDDHLVARFQAGDGRAFDDLVALHTDRLFALSLGLLRQREDAEEVTQETLLRLYRQLSRARPPKCLRPWLYRVCLNLSLDRQRANRRHPATLELEEAAASLKGSDPAETLLNRELRKMLETALAGLPERQRRVFALCHFAGLTITEIADAIPCAPATVRVHLSRATLRLRAVLAEEKVKYESV
jgi:RNA polymerase sigma-70 factor, ECF subfamily